MVTQIRDPRGQREPGIHLMSPAMRRKQARERIDAYYLDSGGASSPLGRPNMVVRAGGDGLTDLPGNAGWKADYQHGAICFLNGTSQVVSVTGAIYTDWDPARVGMPVADRTSEPGGASQEFGHPAAGRVVGYEEAVATDAHFVQGEILRRYLELGGPAGVLNYPESNEVAAPSASNARVTHFRNGAIYYRDDLGPVELTGAHWRGYHLTGATSGFLGFTRGGPLRKVGDTWVADFDNGSIYVLADKPFALLSEIAQFYESDMGGPAGPLGNPVDDHLLPTGGSDTVSFEHGNIVRRDPAQGAVFLMGAAYQPSDHHVTMKWRSSPSENHAYVVLYVDNQRADDGEYTDSGWASRPVPRRGMVSVSVDSYHRYGGLFGGAVHLSGNAISTAFSVQDPNLTGSIAQVPTTTQLKVKFTAPSSVVPLHSFTRFALTGHQVQLVANNQRFSPTIAVPTGQAVLEASFDLTSVVSAQQLAFELTGEIQAVTTDPDSHGAPVQSQRTLQLPTPQPDRILRGEQKTIAFFVRFVKTVSSEYWELYR